MRKLFFWLLDRVHCICDRHCWIFLYRDELVSFDEKIPVIWSKCLVCNRIKKEIVYHRAKPIFKGLSPRSRVDPPHKEHKPYMELMVMPEQTMFMPKGGKLS